MASEQSPTLVRTIGGFKLVKALLLFAAALGAFRLIGHDAAEAMLRFVHQLHVDPYGRLVRGALDKSAHLDDATLRKISIGGLLYGAVFATEGVGLLLDKHWAHWLTVIVTASFVPFEVYELAERFTAVRLAFLVLNVAILVYLVQRIRQRKKQGAKGAERRASHPATA